jgi:hypothetical protein
MSESVEPLRCGAEVVVRGLMAESLTPWRKGDEDFCVVAFSGTSAARVRIERELDVERVTGVSRHQLRPDLYPREESLPSSPPSSGSAS